MQQVRSVVEIALAAVGGTFLIPFVTLLLNSSFEGIRDFLSVSMYENVGQLVFYLTLDSTLTLAIILLLLRVSGRSLKDLGWKKQGWLSEFLSGAATLPLLFGSTFLIGVMFRLFLPQYVSQENPLLEMIQDRTDLTLLLMTSVYVGGIKEEIQRAFVLENFKAHLGGVVPGLVLWSIFFGIGHSFQGVDYAVAAGVLGLLFGLIYLRRRHLAAPIGAHALYDMVTLAIFWNISHS